jgi:hypothetical protein
MTGTPDLSVVVVTHNGRDLARATLRSARAGRGTAGVQWIVVDSGSTDGTPDALEREWPDVMVLRRPNIGFAAANNVGLAQARGRYVLLLNPDVEILEGTLGDLVEAMDRRPDVGAASVVQREAGGRLQPSMRRFPSPGRQLGEALLADRVPLLRRLQEPDTSEDHYARECPADWLVGAFLAVRADAVRTVGELDERFFLYSEETDWCFRIKQAGWEVRHLPVMEVVHHGGGYPRPDLAAQLSYSKILFARKHFGALKRLGLRLALILRHALRAAAFGVAVLASPSARARHRAERRALAVALGLYRPSLADASPPPQAIRS